MNKHNWWSWMLLAFAVTLIALEAFQGRWWMYAVNAGTVVFSVLTIRTQAKTEAYLEMQRVWQRSA